MASIIQGYNYDIFISYRQKDNKGDRWVSEFVEALKTELESTFKEEISVYFDINPHDGLLETHDVDESLKEKLKCLVFIPIISRTYCDPKSFAWEHEFKAFVEQGSKDKFGLKVKLPNGNVASRVLPVRIYDLDASDIKLCESVLGGVLRGVDFIYSEPGVNIPLKSDDDEKINLNKTKYRNQINKVSNSIKEIISGFKNVTIGSTFERKEALLIEDKPLIKENSIIVLPFENISPDPDQEYFSDGLTEEVITDLSHIHDLLVISRNSAMTFKGTKKKTKEIASEVNVRYVLEGSVRRSGNNLRITAQLIDALTDTHLWAEKYNGTLDDVFDIQEKVSRSIADSLPITLSTTERKITKSYLKFESLAYDCLLKARYEIWLGAESSIKRAIGYLNEAKERIGETIEILSSEAEAYYLLPHITGEGFENSVKTIEKNVEAIFKIDHASAYGYLYQGLASTKKDWGFQKASNSLKQAFDLNPRDTSILIFRALVLSEAGYPDKALFYSDRLFELDPITPVNKAQRSFILLLLGQFESSKKLIGEVMSIDPKNSYYGGFAAVFYANMGEKEELLRITTELQSLPIDNWVRMGLMYGYALQDKIKDMNKILTPQFKHTAKWDETFSWTLAQCFACVNNFDESLYWLENAVKRGFTNYPYFNDHDPFLGKMRGEKRFTKLMERVKYEWENFEV